MSLNPGDFRNIVVIMTDKHMGNFVVSLPAIYALKEFFKGKNFYLVVDSEYKELVEIIYGHDDILPYPRKKLRENAHIKHILIFSRFLKQLRGLSPDITIDLEGRHVSATLSFLSGAAVRAGRSTAQRSYLYNLKCQTNNRGRHISFRYLNIASSLGADVNGLKYRPEISNTAKKGLREKLDSEGIKADRPNICIHAGSRKIYKQWRAEGFAEVSDWLSSMGHQVLFIGSSGDLQIINSISALLKYPSFNLAGRLSLGELMALFKMSTLYLGIDSGPMHLADAMCMPIVALFGPADEKTWGPLSEGSIVLRGEERCQKCTGRHCQYNFKCIRTVTADNVKNAIKRLL